MLWMKNKGVTKTEALVGCRGTSLIRNTPLLGSYSRTNVTVKVTRPPGKFSGTK